MAQNVASPHSLSLSLPRCSLPPRRLEQIRRKIGVLKLSYLIAVIKWVTSAACYEIREFYMMCVLDVETEDVFCAEFSLCVLLRGSCIIPAFWLLTIALNLRYKQYSGIKMLFTGCLLRCKAYEYQMTSATSFTRSQPPTARQVLGTTAADFFDLWYCRERVLGVAVTTVILVICGWFFTLRVHLPSTKSPTVCHKIYSTV